MKQLYNILLVTVGVALASTALCSPTLGQECVRDERAIIDEFKSEAPKAWVDYVATFKKLRVVQRHTTTFNYTPYYCEKHKDAEANKQTFWIGSFDGCNMLAEGGDVERLRYASGNNDKYRFQLAKDADDAWKIEEEKAWDNKSPLSGKIDPSCSDDINLGDNGVLRYYLSGLQGLMVSSAYFPILFKQPEFKIESAEEIGEGDARRVRIRFMREATDAAPWAVGAGELTFIPSRYWQIEKGECVLLDDYLNSNKRWENEFQDVELDAKKTFPILLRQTSQLYEGENAGKLLCDSTEEVETEIVPKFERDRFQLSYYGFPEPIFAEDQAGERKRWVLIAIGGVLILAAVLLFRKRRIEA